jgi:hypothetical protein
MRVKLSLFINYQYHQTSHLHVEKMGRSKLNNILLYTLVTQLRQITIALLTIPL